MVFDHDEIPNNLNFIFKKADLNNTPDSFEYYLRPEDILLRYSIKYLSNNKEKYLEIDLGILDCERIKSSFFHENNKLNFFYYIENIEIPLSVMNFMESLVKRIKNELKIEINFDKSYNKDWCLNLSKNCKILVEFEENYRHYDTLQLRNFKIKPTIQIYTINKTTRHCREECKDYNIIMRITKLEIVK